MAAFARRAQQRQAGAERTVYCWPEHRAVLQLYLDVQTQWREGGLDYAGVEAHLRVTGIRGAERRERWAELQVMEHATLQAWIRRRAQQTGR